MHFHTLRCCIYLALTSVVVAAASARVNRIVGGEEVEPNSVPYVVSPTMTSTHMPSITLVVLLMSIG